MENSREVRSGRARTRQLQRQQRGGHDTRLRVPQALAPGMVNQLIPLRWFVQDYVYTLSRNPVIVRAVVGLVCLVSLIFIGSRLIEDRLFPNVWALSIGLGDLRSEDAANRLAEAWSNEITVRLIDGDRVWSGTPTEMGISLNAAETAARAKGVGLAGIPFGYSVEPVVAVDREVARQFFTNLANDIKLAPYGAGFRWEGDQLIGVQGRDGRDLLVQENVTQLMERASEIVQTRLLDLIMVPVPPAVVDPSPLREAARALTNQPFEVIGYDPFRDETLIWTTDRDTFASWLEVKPEGLAVRESAFVPFLQAQNASLDSGERPRYLDSEETLNTLSSAFANGESAARLRIRHQPRAYTVVSGDSGYRIARKAGVPYFLLEQANPGRDLSVLSPGDVVDLPSPDTMVPLDPVASKRIVVNLTTQSLAAFENGQQVFAWSISSGIEDAPTSPGVFQILSHEPVAYGSSYTLCDSTGCGQWEMEWFMGIYEAVPGLINGFHGAVLLPNGAYLGGGNVGEPYTFGCVMSPADQARQLYDWAEEGTVVEIISSEYAPQSALARSMVLPV